MGQSKMMSTTRNFLVLLQFLSHMTTFVQTATDYLVREGEEVTMSCSHDQGLTVIWDIEASGLVIAINGQLQGQASDNYTLEVNAGTQVLTIPSVTFDHGGIYRCYVFGSSDVEKFNVSVMVAPEHTLLLIPPAVAGQALYPRCVAFASNPPAQMSWKLVYPDGRELVPPSFDSDTSHTNGTTTRSSLALLTAESDLYGATLSCDISVPDLSYSKELIDVIYLNVPPDDPYLIGLDPDKPMYAGNNHVIQCVAKNGRPAAEIEWAWDGSRINPDATEVTTNDNGTYDVISKVNINNLKPHHNEDYFECTVTNDALKETSEQFILLNGTLIVYYAPHITVSVQSPDGTTNIFEGMTLEFECDIEAHPNITRIGWLLDGEQVTEDDRHIIEENWMKPDLHIIGVTSEDKGEYQCAAENGIGPSKSEKLNLVIFHRPVCKRYQMIRYAVSVGSSVQLECHTEAFPNVQLKFDWSTNGTEWITSDGIAYPNDEDYAMSNITYRVSSEEDYGEILCKATNGVGEMASPCVISIEHPGPAEAPAFCEATETGSDYIKIQCYEVFRGGSQPSYSLLVARNNLYFEEYFNKTAPLYEMYGLLPETTYHIKVCASNKDFWREVSCSQQFRLTTHNGTVEFSPEEPNSVSAYVPYIAAGATLVLLFIILIISFICIQKICKKDKNEDSSSAESGSIRDAETGDGESIDLRLQSEVYSSRKTSVGSESTGSRRSGHKLAKSVGVAVVHTKMRKSRRGSKDSSSTVSSKSEGHVNPAYFGEEEGEHLYDQADGLKGSMRQSTIDTIVKEAQDDSDLSSTRGAGDAISDDGNTKSSDSNPDDGQTESDDAGAKSEDTKSDADETKSDDINAISEDAKSDDGDTKSDKKCDDGDTTSDDSKSDDAKSIGGAE